MLSRSDRFIVTCDIPPKAKTAFDDRKSFTETVAKWGPVIGVEPMIIDIPSDLRIVLEAKTPQAKRYFLEIDIVKGVTKVTVDIRRIGQTIVIAAYSDLPRNQQKLSAIRPDTDAPRIIDAMKQLSLFLGIAPDSCYLI
jgi:hypothetical protein